MKENGRMKTDQLMFGAAYYPEYMPYDRMEADFSMMKKAGINTIRVEHTGTEGRGV